MQQVFCSCLADYSGDISTNTSVTKRTTGRLWDRYSDAASEPRDPARLAPVEWAARKHCGPFRMGLRTMILTTAMRRRLLVN